MPPPLKLDGENVVDHQLLSGELFDFAQILHSQRTVSSNSLQGDGVQRVTLTVLTSRISTAPTMYIDEAADVPR